MSAVVLPIAARQSRAVQSRAIVAGALNDRAQRHRQRQRQTLSQMLQDGGA